MSHIDVMHPLTPSKWSRFRQFTLVRILVALICVLVPTALVITFCNTLLKIWLPDHAMRTGWPQLLIAATIYLSYRAYVRWVEKRAVSEFSGAGALRELGTGWLTGMLLFGLCIAVLAALGVYHVTGSNHWNVLIGPLADGIMAAVMEEVVMRGVVFRMVEASLGSWYALLISAAIFGLLHLGNPNATVIAASAIMIEAGIMLAAAYMLTRRLWLCIGIHAAWNFTQGGIFSVAVSGVAGKGLLNGALQGPDWLTGGSFGIEASLIAVLVCGALGMYLLFRARQQGRIVAPFWKKSVGATASWAVQG